QAARQCAINAVAALNSQIDLDDIKSIVKVQVFVNCTEDFIQSPEVANGASELLVEVFGEAGRHTRAAVGVYQLPKGAAVEVDLIAEI
ncbi:MAG: RidA family protein, partial [Defluviitaleaceae bacterium]|nr:RidA family protein [Defluviitaleaceae bacterium]